MIAERLTKMIVSKEIAIRFDSLKTSKKCSKLRAYVNSVSLKVASWRAGVLVGVYNL